MLELGNVLRTNYGAWVIKGAYSGLDGLVKVPVDSTGSPPRVYRGDDDKAASTIQNLLHGKVDSTGSPPRVYRGVDKSQRDIRYANKVISAVQELADSAGDINKKVKAMKDLAEKAASGDYSKQELAEMRIRQAHRPEFIEGQKEFEKLAEQVNDIAGNTEYNGNKLFTVDSTGSPPRVYRGADGKNISISIGNGSNIDIVSKDLSFDIKGLDLTKVDSTGSPPRVYRGDAKGALSAVASTGSPPRVYRGVEAALTKSDYYAGYVNNQAERIVDSTGSPPRVYRGAANKSLEDMSALLDAQANVEPARALQLLINDET